MHNIGEIDGEGAVSSDDALLSPPKQTVDMVLSNPPFGKKSSMTFTNEEAEQILMSCYGKYFLDFWMTDSAGEDLQYWYKRPAEMGVDRASSLYFEAYPEKIARL